MNEKRDENFLRRRILAKRRPPLGARSVILQTRPSAAAVQSYASFYELSPVFGAF